MADGNGDWVKGVLDTSTARALAGCFILPCFQSMRGLFESIALTGPILRLLGANKDYIQDGKSAALGAGCSA